MCLLNDLAGENAQDFLYCIKLLVILKSISILRFLDNNLDFLDHP